MSSQLPLTLVFYSVKCAMLAQPRSSSLPLLLLQAVALLGAVVKGRQEKCRRTNR
jgi:hypothetical protein